MKHKSGDEVLIKGKVMAVDRGKSGNPYWVGVSNGMGYWLNEADITDKTYEQGLADAWELVRKLGEIEQDEREKMFSYRSVKAIIEDCTIEEVMDKIEAYEKEKKIEVGDEVVLDYHEEKTMFIVTRICGGFISGFDKEGKTHSYVFPNRFIQKTGKHIDIESLLRQIGE